eukprot:TRINITY_DN9901_c0_g1_i1.p1 TRINITY_DN9901_c0_g1~~TRINITY_DN9901_c0_g1_i1.p1  ORF type:complete len:356 (+),score=67.27 TRINITY_DN9901_c0_g1_i1:3-1070(+)
MTSLLLDIPIEIAVPAHMALIVETERARKRKAEAEEAEKTRQELKKEKLRLKRTKARQRAKAKRLGSAGENTGSDAVDDSAADTDAAEAEDQNTAPQAKTAPVKCSPPREILFVPRRLQTSPIAQESPLATRASPPVPDLVQPESEKKQEESPKKKLRLSDIAETGMEQPTTVPALTPLNRSWTWWFDKKAKKGAADWEDGVKKFGTFDSVELFWRYFNNIVGVTDLADQANLRVFDANVQPAWEDPRNANGGKFGFCLPRASPAAAEAWNDLLLALIGEALSFFPHVCGAVISIRGPQARFSVWIDHCPPGHSSIEWASEIQEFLGLKHAPVFESHNTQGHPLPPTSTSSKTHR